MIQIVFTDNGKVHTVTFSGEDAKKWAYIFQYDLHDKYNIESEWRVV